MELQLRWRLAFHLGPEELLKPPLDPIVLGSNYLPPLRKVVEVGVRGVHPYLLRRGTSLRRSFWVDCASPYSGQTGCGLPSHTPSMVFDGVRATSGHAVSSPTMPYSPYSSRSRASTGGQCIDLKVLACVFLGAESCFLDLLFVCL